MAANNDQSGDVTATSPWNQVVHDTVREPEPVSLVAALPVGNDLSPIKTISSPKDGGLKNQFLCVSKLPFSLVAASTSNLNNITHPALQFSYLAIPFQQHAMQFPSGYP
ncbi:hypothetical protein Tco_1292625 [Tanacetum coccineum]